MTDNQILTHQDLVLRGAKWLRNRHRGCPGCNVILTEFVTSGSAIPDVIGFNRWDSVVLECKVSRSDFLADKRKIHRHSFNQCGNYRYYLVLPNIVSVEDIPEGWGLLYLQARCINIIKPSVRNSEPNVRAAEYSILYSIARRAEIRGYIPSLRKPYKEVAGDR